MIVECRELKAESARNLSLSLSLPLPLSIYPWFHFLFTKFDKLDYHINKTKLILFHLKNDR